MSMRDTCQLSALQAGASHGGELWCEKEHGMCACVHVCVCMAGVFAAWAMGGCMVGIVMREEKVRQCKVFVVLMQGEDSCLEGSDAAVAPAKRLVCGGQG